MIEITETLGWMALVVVAAAARDWMASAVRSGWSASGRPDAVAPKGQRSATAEGALGSNDRTADDVGA